jgi:hypothetical protein
MEMEKDAKNTPSLESILTEAVEASKLFEASVRYQTTAAAEMQSTSIMLSVRFEDAEPAKASLDLQMLLEQLAQQTVLAEVTLLARPHPQVVIHGAKDNENYRIIIDLDASSGK